MARSAKRKGRLKLDWLVGRPGAGKTTTVNKVFQKWSEGRDVRLTHADVKEVPGLGCQGVWVRFYGDDAVVLGVYERKRVGKKVRLRGSDCYTTVERTRLKFIVEWLAKHRPEVKYVLIEGLMPAQKPMIAAVKKFTDLRTVVLDVPRDVSEPRFWQRNREMVAKGQLKHMPDGRALVNGDRKMDWVIEAAGANVLRCSQDDAVKAIVERRASCAPK